MGTEVANVGPQSSVGSVQEGRPDGTGLAGRLHHRAAAAPVTPAGALALQRTVGNRAVALLMQPARARLGTMEPTLLPEQEVAEKAPTVDADGRVIRPRRGVPMPGRLSGDVLLEQMAHSWAYVDSVALPLDAQKVLKASGYVGGGLIRGRNGLQMRVFTPLDPSEGLAPVVAFRGTDPTELADLATDANPDGVGFDQYYRNLALIEVTIRRAAAGGRVTVVGHSLGGALAQIAASQQPFSVGKVTTFQGAGISTDRLDEVVAYNAAHPDKAIYADHHRPRDDVAQMAGEAFLPGTIHDHTNVNPKKHGLAAHQQFPLTSAAGVEGMPGVEGATPGWSEVGTSSAEKENEGTHRSEAARQGVRPAANAAGAAVKGVLAGPVGASLEVDWHSLVSDDADAMKLWGQLLQMREAHVPMSKIKAFITYSNLADENKAYLKSQLAHVSTDALSGPSSKPYRPAGI